MYLEHFKLTELPFSITPDTSFFFSSASSQQALNTLLVAARSGEGFIKITGEVGTGKTLLCRQLLKCIGNEFETAYIPNPTLEPNALLLELAVELGAGTEMLKHASSAQYQHLLLRALTKRLMSLARAGKRALVCLDEVQAMPIETLEALRLLTNLETEKRKLVQVVIFGQPELDARLDHPSVRQLRQRITFEHRLDPLSGPETGLYVDHRLTVAGYQGLRLFSAPALWMLQRRTRGLPRLVNIVAHKALMSSYGKGRRWVGLWDMANAVADTTSLRLSARDKVLGSLLVCGLLLVIVGWARIA